MTKKTEKQKKIKNNILTTVLIATIFGLSAGFASTSMFKSHIINEIYSMPMYEKTNISNDSIRRANIVMENAQKIIVEQDNRVEAAINSGHNSIIGVFKKKGQLEDADKKDDKEFDLSRYYKLDENIAQGIVITSDGWVLANNFIKDLTAKDVIDGYVIITAKKEIYEIDSIVKSDFPSYIFLHIADVKELPVKRFIDTNNLSEGQILVATNWGGSGYLTSIVLRDNDNSQEILSADKNYSQLILADNFKESLFVFNLKDELVGVFDEKELITVNYFQSVVRGLFEKKEVTRPLLGVNYIDLSNFTIADNAHKKGALIYGEDGVALGSVAEEAGLKIGDIILSVDNKEVNGNNSLSSIMLDYLLGDELTIIYLREGDERLTKIILKNNG